MGTEMSTQMQFAETAQGTAEMMVEPVLRWDQRGIPPAQTPIYQQHPAGGWQETAAPDAFRVGIYLGHGLVATVFFEGVA